MGDWPNEGRLSVLAIRKACEASLKRLHTDHIDLYQMHHIDRDAWWNEVWQAMELLVQQGKILYVGSSNFAGWHIARANEIARARNFLGLASEQSLYNLERADGRARGPSRGSRVRHGVHPVQPACRAGCLAGALSKVEEGRRSSEYLQGEIQEHRDQLERWEMLCGELGERPSDVALAWLLAQPGVTSPIIGPRTPDQLHASMRALEIHLDDDVLKRLDEIFPGPGGSAPEAYAW